MRGVLYCTVVPTVYRKEMKMNSRCQYIRLLQMPAARGKFEVGTTYNWGKHILSKWHVVKCVEG